jgi:hypothetical protein
METTGHDGFGSSSTSSYDYATKAGVGGTEEEGLFDLVEVDDSCEGEAALEADGGAAFVARGG